MSISVGLPEGIEAKLDKDAPDWRISGKCVHVVLLYYYRNRSRSKICCRVLLPEGLDIADADTERCHIFLSSCRPGCHVRGTCGMSDLPDRSVHPLCGNAFCPCTSDLPSLR